MRVSFRGRTRRQDFFAMTVILGIVGLIFLVPTEIGTLSLVSAYSNEIPANIAAEALGGLRTPTYLGWILFIIGSAGVALVLFGFTWVSVRRLHDLDLTGHLVFVLPALQGVLYGTGWSMFSPLILAFLIWIFILSVTPGTKGPNAFGPDPGQPALSSPE